MRKRIEVRLIDPDFENSAIDTLLSTETALSYANLEADMYGYSDHPRIHYGDCPNIIEKSKKKISAEDISDMFDSLIAYFYENKFYLMVVDLEQRDRYLEPAKEMTLEEIEKKLGYKVKIVNDNKEE